MKRTAGIATLVGALAVGGALTGCQHGPDTPGQAHSTTDDAPAPYAPNGPVYGGWPGYSGVCNPCSPYSGPPIGRGTGTGSSAGTGGEEEDPYGAGNSGAASGSRGGGNAAGIPAQGTG